MAEGWARYLKSDVIAPYSAGIEPDKLNPRAAKVMAEAGIDISGHRSKPIDELKDILFDYVITLCDHAKEYCPIFPGSAKKAHRGFDDPSRLAANSETEDEILGHYRRVRDEIRAFVETLPGVLAKGVLQ